MGAVKATDTKAVANVDNSSVTDGDIMEGEIVDANHVFVSKVDVETGDLTSAVNSYVPDTKAENKLVRRVDFMVMPMLWIMCVMCYVDRNNIGNAAAAGMDADLKLTDKNYSMLISIFFVGYIIWEIPSNLLISRLRPSLYLPGMMVTTQ
ncbi:hypothetical protein SEUCBS139899_003738 [Sporothrix eucalyptigena]